MQLSTSGAVTELRTIVSAPFDQASAVLPQVYTCPEFNRLEVEQIFAQEWMCVGRASSLAEPGESLRCELADQPVIVMRDGTDHYGETFYRTHVWGANRKLLVEVFMKSFRLPACHQLTVEPKVYEPPSMSRVRGSMRGASSCAHDVPEIARSRA